MRVRPQGAAQPRQGVPDAPPLRRTGADAHPPRPGAAPRSAALLMRPTNEDEVRDAIAEAIRSGATLDIRGGGSKAAIGAPRPEARSEEHTSELQSLMRISYAVFCLKKKKQNRTATNKHT